MINFFDRAGPQAKACGSEGAEVDRAVSFSPRSKPEGAVSLFFIGV